MEAYHGHVYILVKHGIISRMSKNTFNIGCPVGQKHPFESMRFLDISQLNPILSLACMTNSRHHARLFCFSTNFVFYGVFRSKKTNKVGCDAICIRCRNSCKQDIDAYNGHAHLLENAGGHFMHVEK